MPRDIPVSVPNQIRALIKERWGDIQSFASANDLTYSEAYNMIVRSGAKRALKLTKTISGNTGCTRDEAAAIFFLTGVEERREAFEDLAKSAGVTLTKLSEICFGSKGYIFELISDPSSGVRVRRLIHLVNALGLDLDSFEQLYDDDFVAA